jgi:tetratricopeptide (TPR) repeat protein
MQPKVSTPGARRLAVAGAILVTMLSFGTASPLWAQPTEEAKAQARAHFKRGKAAFELGKFQEALQAYEAAYQTLPLPGFLFNIGQCYRNLDNYEKAIFSFRLYLRKLPEARNRAAVESLIEELEAKAEEERRQKQALRPAVPDYEPKPDRRPIRYTAPPPKPPKKPPFYTQWWFWVPVAAVVIAGGAVGVYYAARPEEAELPSSTLGVWDLNH